MDAPVQGALSRLPHELLAEIFLHHLELEPEDDMWPFRPLPLPSPLLLGRICSTWRHIVHGTPKLWSSFSLRIRGKIEQGKVDHVSFAKAWLARAHPYPLSVSLRVDLSIKSLCRIIDAIQLSADRLQVIKLDLPFLYYRPLVDIAAGSMAMLESVDLRLPILYTSKATPWAKRITAFTTAPRLRSVTSRFYEPNFFIDRLQMPWSQLTKLRMITGFYCDGLFHIFLQCTNLIDCTLELGVWENSMSILPIVIFPHLQKLDVAFTGPGDQFQFFQPLNLPALKDLTVTIFGDRSGFYPIFMEFTLRSALDLERLRFSGVNICSADLLQFLSLMQSLTELNILLSPCLDDNLFDALCYRGMDSQNLVPKLEKLLISRDMHDGIDVIANMIESRWWIDDTPRAVSRFERVDVFFNDREIDVRVQARLERCRREGLNLNLRCGRY
jgi:hypothetical protein